MRTDQTLCLNSKVDGKQPSLEYRIYHTGGVAAVVTTSFQYNILEIVYENSSSTNIQEE